MIMHEISEPIDVANSEEVAVGIDLGTTNSLIAIKKKNGEIFIIPDDDGHKLTPSVVLYSAEGVLVGNQIKSHNNAISSVKRLMGKSLDDITQEPDAFKYIANQNDKSIILEGNGQFVSPIEVSSEILKKLKKQAELYLKQEITKAVITVPAYFDDASRNATKLAAQLAGLEVLRVVNEPTAAAIAYGFDKKDQGAFLVYDLGGGTFDISVLQKMKGILEVISVAGDNKIGGDDFDKALFEMINAHHLLDLTFNQEIKQKIREIRECLSIERHWEGEICEKAIKVTRDEFEGAVASIVANTIKLVKKALRDAKLDPKQISDIVMVGGMTRTPAIQKAVTNLFGKPVLTQINPDEIVVLGAAIQAYSLTHPDDSSLLLDVTPLSLGLELVGGLVETIIPRNTSIPISVTKSFTNYDPEQTGMKLHVVQGEKQMVGECRSLARLELKNIKKMPAGEARIEVTFIVDADGILTVSAKDKHSNTSQELTFHPSYGLSESEIISLLDRS